jgi:aspartyl-tRNA(Asn)/glutamyl-tRNA(Gln) amidotransferase subunit C
MTLTLEQVQHIARLARLQLSLDELELYREQLSDILDYAARLQELDTADIPPTASVASGSRPLRLDIPRPGLDLDALLQNAPQTEQDQFRVPPVLE